MNDKNTAMDKKTIVLESYPDFLQARIEKRERERNRHMPNYVNGNISQLVLDDLKLWRVGVLEVSFKGGDPVLHKKIADVAKIWSDYGNIEFDFGHDPQNQTYRTWTPTDTSHIRVGFDQEGYWSLVGTDSSDTEIVAPGEITLNLSGFDVQLPVNWKTVVLHEFGHALGFHHEHQSPDFECDFDWPKVYDYLAGPPNYWPKWKVDHNLRQLKRGNLTYSAHDKNSIMHYSFPAWMFITGEDSQCHTPENLELSAEDKKMMAEAYPVEPVRIQRLDAYRMDNLESLAKNRSLTKSLREQHKNQLEYYRRCQ